MAEGGTVLGMSVGAPSFHPESRFGLKGGVENKGGV